MTTVAQINELYAHELAEIRAPLEREIERLKIKLNGAEEVARLDHIDSRERIEELEQQLENRDGATWKELNDNRLEAWRQYFDLKVKCAELESQLATARDAALEEAAIIVESRTIGLLIVEEIRALKGKP